jgi:hypothetical protein
MTRLRLGRWQLPLCTSVALVAGGIFAACTPNPTPTPGPFVLVGGCPRGVDPKTPAEWNACIKGLAFDSDSEYSELQPLTVIGDPGGSPCPGDPKKTCRFGPLAKIEPLVGAHKLSERELREGRIIARISIPSTEREGYEKFGLQPGQTTYWWVRTDASGTGGKSIFVTQTRDGKIEGKPVERPLRRYKYHEGEELRRAMAQWIWTLEDETAKGTCGTASCKSP